jgi:threonine efflux protein
MLVGPTQPTGCSPDRGLCPSAVQFLTIVRLLPLLVVWILAVISPGPDFLVTVQQATSRSRRHGILAGLGVSTAILLWATASMLGLSMVLARISWLYDTVRMAGAAYLVYLGVRTLWAARRNPYAAEAGPAPEEVPGRETTTGRPGGLARAWRLGFLTNIGNPKAVVFFGSLLGALLPADTGVTLRVVVVVGLAVTAASWFTVVAALFGLPPIVNLYRRGRRWIDRITGVIFIALGGRLALER